MHIFYIFQSLFEMVVCTLLGTKHLDAPSGSILKYNCTFYARIKQAWTRLLRWMLWLSSATCTTVRSHDLHLGLWTQASAVIQAGKKTQRTGWHPEHNPEQTCTCQVGNINNKELDGIGHISQIKPVRCQGGKWQQQRNEWHLAHQPDQAR